MYIAAPQPYYPSDAAASFFNLFDNGLNAAASIYGRIQAIKLMDDETPDVVAPVQVQAPAATTSAASFLTSQNGIVLVIGAVVLVAAIFAFTRK